MSLIISLLLLIATLLLTTTSALLTSHQEPPPTSPPADTPTSLSATAIAAMLVGGLAMGILITVGVCMFIPRERVREGLDGAIERAGWLMRQIVSSFHSYARVPLANVS